MYKFVTISEAAKTRGLPPYAIRRWIKNKQIRFCKSGNRYIINLDWLDEDLERMAEQNMAASESQTTEYGQLRKVKL